MSAPSERPEGAWVEAPFARDLAGMLAWSLPFTLLFWAALITSVYGIGGLWTHLWIYLVSLVLIVPGSLFFVYATTARRVRAQTEVLCLVRVRKVECVPWSGVKIGYRPPWTWPFVGHRYPVVLTGGPFGEVHPLRLTRTQAECVASHFGKTVEETWLPRRLAKRPG